MTNNLKCRPPPNFIAIDAKKAKETIWCVDENLNKVNKVRGGLIMRQFWHRTMIKVRLRFVIEIFLDFSFAILKVSWQNLSKKQTQVYLQWDIKLVVLIDNNNNNKAC